MKQKGLAPILIIIVVTMVLAIAGYLGYRWIQSMTRAYFTRAVDNIVNKINERAESTTSAQISSWKTYTNEEFGYSFQYPANTDFSPETVYNHNASEDEKMAGSNIIAKAILITNDTCVNADEFDSYTNFQKASQSAECNLPGVRTTSGKLNLPVVDKQQTHVNDLSQYSFYLEGYNPKKGYSTKMGPFYAFFFSKSIQKEKDGISTTYYGVYLTPNPIDQFGPIDPERMKLFNQILATFRFEPISAKPVNFLKRYFKTTDKIFSSEEYPMEIKSLTDEQLIGLNCSEQFGSVSDKISQTDFQNDPILQKILNAARNLDYYKTIQAARYCELEDGRILAVLYNAPDESRRTSVNFGLLENEKLNMKVSFQPPGEGGMPLFYLNPLAYTTDDKFYYSQGGGDNVAEIHIQRIDLRANTHESILNCLDAYDIYANDKPTTVKPSCR